MMVHATPSERFDRAEGSSPLRSDRAYYDPRWIKIELGWNARDLSSPAALAHIASLAQRSGVEWEVSHFIISKTSSIAAPAVTIAGVYRSTLHPSRTAALYL